MGVLSIRSKFIEQELLSRKQDEKDPIFRALANGWVPADLEPAFNEYMAANQTDSEDSAIDVISFQNFFYLNPGKILGRTTVGTGWLNPLIIKGTSGSAVGQINGFLGDFVDSAKEDEQDISRFGLPVEEKIEESEHSNQTNMEDQKTETNQNLASPSVSVTDDQVDKIIKKGLLKTPGKKFKGHKITVEEAIPVLNPNITEEEIQAWVWYRRQFGNPMKGWENWFLGKTTSNDDKSLLIITKEEAVLKDNAFRDLRIVPANTVVGKKSKAKNVEYNDTTYIVVITPQRELVWVDKKNIKETVNNLDNGTQKDLDRLTLAGALIFDGEEYFPVPVYLFGDIYKRLRKITENQSIIIEKYGQEYYDKLMIKVQQYKPKMRSFREPIPQNRPHILSLSEFANDPVQFKVKELNEEANVKIGVWRRNRFYAEEEGVSLFDAFRLWVEETIKDTDLKSTTKADIKNLYWAKSVRWPKDTEGKDLYTQAQKDEMVGNARVESERLFSDFLATSLTFDDSVALDVIWNEKYNAFTKIDQFVDKIPVSYAGSSMFKMDELEIKPAQRKGLAFLQLNGSGCIGYDVGFGKTLVGILNIAQEMAQANVKRPLLVVPKPVYRNWRKEIFGYWTDGIAEAFEEFDGAVFHYGVLTDAGIKFNDWYNLSGSHYEKLIKKHGDLNKLIPEGTITIVSYKGFEKMGFSRDISNDMFDSISRVIQQKETFEDAKEQLSFYNQVREMLGLGNKNAVIAVDRCGFDHITVDEAHNFKNVFDNCGKDPSTGRKLFGISASRSNRAVKMFFVTQYIQRRHGKKVTLLTATPFTNSPLEMYSILSFVGLDTLNQYNLFNIRKFFENFILETVEYAVNAKGEIVTKPVIKSFQNLKLLQTLLRNHIDFRDNPREAGVIRPCKLDLPNKRTSTYLDMSEWQIKNQAIVKSIASSVSRNNKGAALRAINLSLDNAFSPYLFSNEQPESAEEFVENSPKIKYAIGCIKSVLDYHYSRGEEMSGQIIYSNRGKDYFEYIKQVLESVCGFKRGVIFDEDKLDEVEIITGGGGEADEDRKEIIKDAFNAGIVKVIIGTSTIREGVNLQKRGTVIYDLYPEWNPTDIRQLQGRIWRQGNMYKYVRFVMPLVINSMDNFIYQKQDEKSKRIASLWEQTADDVNQVVVTEELDPSEIKYELVEDAKEKLKIKIDTIVKSAQKEVRILEENRDVMVNANYDIQTLKDSMLSNYEEYKEEFPGWQTYANILETKAIPLAVRRENKEVEKKLRDTLDKLNELIDVFLSFEASNNSDVAILLNMIRMLNARSFYPFLKESALEREIQSMIRSYEWKFGVNDWIYNKLKSSYSSVIKIEKSVLKAYGKTWLDDISDIKDQIDEALQKSSEYLTFVNSSDYSAAMLIEIQNELEQRKAIRGDLNDQVRNFAETNVLLSYLADNNIQHPDYITDADYDCIIPMVECCPTNAGTERPVDKSKEYVPELVQEAEEVETGDASIEELTEQLETARMSIDYLEGAERDEMQEYIDVLEMTIASMEKDIKGEDIPLASENKEKILYGTKGKKLKTIKKKGSIITFKERFGKTKMNNNGYIQIPSKGLIINQDGSVYLSGELYDSDTYKSVEDLMDAIDWDWMEEAHKFNLSEGGRIPNYNTIIGGDNFQTEGFYQDLELGGGVTDEMEDLRQRRAFNAYVDKEIMYFMELGGVSMRPAKLISVVKTDDNVFAGYEQTDFTEKELINVLNTIFHYEAQDAGEAEITSLSEALAALEDQDITYKVTDIHRFNFNESDYFLSEPVIERKKDSSILSADFLVYKGDIANGEISGIVTFSAPDGEGASNVSIMANNDDLKAIQAVIDNRIEQNKRL